MELADLRTDVEFRSKRANTNPAFHFEVDIEEKKVREQRRHDSLKFLRADWKAAVQEVETTEKLMPK
jgi:hypothetical protein